VSILQITDENGTRIVDMAPVEQYERGLDADIQARRFFKNPQRISALRDMTQEQLMHLASILTSKVEEYARLYDGSFSAEHVDLIQKLRGMREAAQAVGEDLWPELK